MRPLIIRFGYEHLGRSVQVSVVRLGWINKFLRRDDAVFLEHHDEHLGIDNRAGVEKFHFRNLTTDGHGWTRILWRRLGKGATFRSLRCGESEGLLLINALDDIPLKRPEGRAPVRLRAANRQLNAVSGKSGFCYQVTHAGYADHSDAGVGQHDIADFIVQLGGPAGRTAGS